MNIPSLAQGQKTIREMDKQASSENTKELGLWLSYCLTFLVSLHFLDKRVSIYIGFLSCE